MTDVAQEEEKSVLDIYGSLSVEGFLDLDCACVGGCAEEDDEGCEEAVVGEAFGEESFCLSALMGSGLSSLWGGCSSAHWS